MATVLKRPMFRIGGPTSDGVGILSGMRRTNFQDQGSWTAGDEEILQETKEKILNPQDPTYGFKELIADAYRTSKGAATGKDWLTNAADLALERTDTKKAEEKAKPMNDLAILQSLKKGSGEYYKQTRPLEVERIREYFDNGMKILDQFETWDDFSNSEQFAEWEFEMSRAIKGFPSSFDVTKMVFAELESHNDKRIQAGLTPLKGDDLENFKKQVVMDIYRRYVPKLKFAKGGRVGYSMGMGPVMDQDVSMTENIQTPGGDMSMTENVDTFSMGQQAGMPSQTMPSDDPFVLLRARLPQEITDDVVRLIAYNPEAFTDFADIETQEDVIAFNKKYGVELVINTDEMSGAIA
tara:strand:- start:4995 stop:6050 length:1056 start_codon:yes stop_codon:yes gene_type:complete